MDAVHLRISSTEHSISRMQKIPTLFLVSLAIFGIGCAISMSLCSTSVILWSFYFMWQSTKALVRDLQNLGIKTVLKMESVFFCGLSYLLFTAIVLMLKTPLTKWQGSLSYLLVFLYWIYTFKNPTLNVSKKVLSRIEIAVGTAYLILWGFCLYQAFALGTVRVVGFHRNPNYLSLGLLPAFIYFGHAVLQDFRSQTYALCAGKFVVFMAILHTLLLSGTRSVFPAALLYLVYLGYQFFRVAQFSKKLSKKYGVAIAVLLVLFGAVLLSTTPTLQRLSKNLSHDRAVLARTEIWKINWQAFTQSPLLGIGFRNNSLAIKDHPQIARYMKGQSSGHFAHNIYLQTLVEGGLLGFLLFYSFLILALIKKPQLRWYILTALIAGLADTMFHISRALYPMIFFCVLANFNQSLWSKKKHAAKTA